MKLKVNSKIIEISNPEKIYFPKDKITKKDLIDYYIKIAPLMIPYMKDRALTLQRYPEGIDGEAFYQKNASSYFPTWIKTIAIEKKTETDDGDKITNYVVCNNKETLAYIANQGCITSHIWLSKIDKLEFPDQMVFDLDPSTKDFNLVRKTALRLKEILDKLNLESYVMTTGSKGLHVRVPILRNFDNNQVKEFAQKIAQILLHETPELITLEFNKSKRGNRLFIDTYRNSYTATAVTPYSVRAKPGAPVATPISWQEVKSSKLESQSYNIKNIFKKISKDKNPWQNFFKQKQNLKKADVLLKKMGAF